MTGGWIVIHWDAKPLFWSDFPKFTVLVHCSLPGLVGALPKELCTLTTLRRLCICRCGLTGRIPAEIGRLTGLEELQLFGNQLSGSVPASISLLTNLKLLSLGEYTGGNNFTSEPLPQCLSTLLNLEALFMANCNIKGPLPDWLGNLTGKTCFFLFITD